MHLTLVRLDSGPDVLPERRAVGGVVQFQGKPLLRQDATGTSGGQEANEQPAGLHITSKEIPEHTSAPVWKRK